MTDQPKPAPSVADQLRELARQLDLTDPDTQLLSLRMELTNGERTWTVTRNPARRTR